MDKTYCDFDWALKKLPERNIRNPIQSNRCNVFVLLIVCWHSELENCCPEASWIRCMTLTDWLTIFLPNYVNLVTNKANSNSSAQLPTITIILILLLVKWWPIRFLLHLHHKKVITSSEKCVWQNLDVSPSDLPARTPLTDNNWSFNEWTLQFSQPMNVNISMHLMNIKRFWSPATGKGSTLFSNIIIYVGEQSQWRCSAV